MRAIYRGVLATITDDTGDGVVLDGELFVPFGDFGLVVDPTDAQVEAAKAGDEIPADPDEPAELREVLGNFGATDEMVDAALQLWSERRPQEMQRRFS